MGYTPEEIEGREFSKVFKGYDKDEVRNYLKHLGDVMGSLRDDVHSVNSELLSTQEQMQELSSKQSEQGQFEALSEHVDEMLRGARGVSEDIRAKAQAKADEIIRDAKLEASNSMAESEALMSERVTAAEQALEKAEAEAQHIIENATKASSEVISKTNIDADKKLSDVQAEVDGILEAANLEANSVRETADNELANIKAEAEAEANKIIEDIKAQLEEAESEAARVVADSKAEAETIISEGKSSAEAYRQEVEESFSAKRTEADSYSSSKRSEADEYHASKLIEADEYVAERQGEVFKDAETAAIERDKALAEIEDARNQVSEMLEQARAQNEFLRQEAEDVIRTKVRTYIDQTERRVSRLKITEQSSRERLLAAQKELNEVLNQVGLGAAEDLGEGTSEAVIAEAQRRMIESGSALDARTQPSAPSQSESSSVDEPEVVETEIIDLNIKGDDSSAVNFVDLQVSAESVDLSDQQTDDALSKLVREAMQQAVDTAAVSESDNN